MSEPLRVIIVDDEPLARDSIRALLEGDAEVRVAGEATGSDAAALIARTRPDILFLDIQMPEVDGFALLEQVGADAVPAIVFVTAYDPRHEGFEDGTPNFLGIAALDAGFDLLDEVGMPRLTARVDELTRCLLDELLALPNVEIYGPLDMTARGGAVAFNVLGVPYTVVESRAREAGVSMRGGCFCNPGASEAAFGLDRFPLSAVLDRLGADFTPERLASHTGGAVGAVRASVGLANHHDDIRKAIDVVAGHTKLERPLHGRALVAIQT
ncbi:MAG: aminotransferase class V-fold PLP-dependent enzyme [Acidobacteriota bacterium]